MFPGVKAIEAVASDGPNNIAFRGSMIIGKDLDSEELRNTIGGYLRNMNTRIGDHIFKPLSEKMTSGDITSFEANLFHTHSVNEVLRRAKVTDYKVEDPTGMLPKIEKKVRKSVAWDDVLKAAQKDLEGMVDMEFLQEDIAAHESERVHKADWFVGLIDPPTLEYATTEELREWKADLDAMPMFADKPDMVRDVHAALAARGQYAFILKYSENQPRDPKGTPTGGQWSATGGEAGNTYGAINVNSGAVRYREDALLDAMVQRGTFTEPKAIDLLNRADENLRGVLAEADIVINRRTLEVLAGIAMDGRIKSQFETGKSDGMLDPNFRSKAESMLFGIDHHDDDEDLWDEDGGRKPGSKIKEFPPALRPIYGYAKDEDDDFDVASEYGRYQLVLKNSVRERTTITGGDSLDYSFDDPRYMPSPIDSPSVVSFTNHSDPDEAANFAAVAANGGLGNTKDIRAHVRYSGYLEVQIHGGVKLSDVKKLRVPKPVVDQEQYREQAEVIMQMYRDAGIEVEVYEFDR